MEGRLVDNGDGTVTDTCTSLMWQKETADVDGNGTIGSEDAPNWQNALQYGENLTLAGHTDWRLPKVRELESIVDYGRNRPAIDPVFGTVISATDPVYYWSSSTAVRNWGVAAWMVDFSDGIRIFDDKTRPYYVRAVRDAR